MIAPGSGVLVNVSSILGVIAQPYGGAHTMSKFAVRGLGVSLREELRLGGRCWAVGAGRSVLGGRCWAPPTAADRGANG